MDADSMAQTLGKGAAVERHRDGLWMDLPLGAVLEMAQIMRQAEARLVTMTAKPTGEPGQFELTYHWDLSGGLLSVRVQVNDKAQSIISLWPAADWVERETHDYYAIEFEGRDETPPLMLREGDKPGLFFATKEVGRTADPAYTDKTGEDVR